MILTVLVSALVVPALTENAAAAQGHLQNAIKAYRSGFTADSRDAFPGINLLTLLDAKGDDASLREKDKLLPVVLYAVEQRLASRAPDYWDHATLLELAVLSKDKERAEQHAGDALAAMRETWEAGTTLRNLRLIREARTARKENISWLKDIEAAFAEASEEKKTTAEDSGARTSKKKKTKIRN